MKVVFSLSTKSNWIEKVILVPICPHRQSKNSRDMFFAVMLIGLWSWYNMNLIKSSSTVACQRSRERAISWLVWKSGNMSWFCTYSINIDFWQHFNILKSCYPQDCFVYFDVEYGFYWWWVRGNKIYFLRYALLNAQKNLDIYFLLKVE